MTTEGDLGPSEKALLRAVVSRWEPDAIGLLDKVGHVRLSIAERELLRGAVASELVESGLDENDDHNEYGRRLDDLIDALGLA